MASRRFVLLGCFGRDFSGVRSTGTQLTRAVPPRSRLARIALVPLDDRPAGLQSAQLAGAIADAEVIGPPRYRLGHFTAEGDADGIAEWLDGLDLSSVDAVIVSTDMLAWRSDRVAPAVAISGEGPAGGSRRSRSSQGPAQGRQAVRLQHAALRCSLRRTGGRKVEGDHRRVGRTGRRQREGPGGRRRGATARD